jgi:hypothetical protein
MLQIYIVDLLLLIYVGQVHIIVIMLVELNHLAGVHVM